MEIAFPWLRGHDITLGHQYLPICTIEIKMRNGKWRSVVLKVDSAVDTILMDKNDCRLLGYTFNDCTPYSYHDINKKRVKCFIRRFSIKIGGFVIRKVPISFSTRSIDRSLLGRSKIFDKLDIFFDSKNKHTIFATPS
jgi:hypothetical protein